MPLFYTVNVFEKFEKCLSFVKLQTFRFVADFPSINLHAYNNSDLF